MKIVMLSTITLLFASVASAQLPSEKNEPVQMSRYKKDLPQKRSSGSDVLPSEKSSPAAIASNRSKKTHPSTGESKVLPSSADFNRRIYTVPRKP